MSRRGSMSAPPAPATTAVGLGFNLRAMYWKARQQLGVKGSGVTAAERWRFTILSVLRVVRALSGFQVSVADLIHRESDALDPPVAAGGGGKAFATGGPGGPEFRLEDYLAHHTVVIPPEIRAVLSKHRAEYTKADFSLIGRLMETMPAFKKYSPEVRKKLTRCAQYEAFGPGRVMIKQNQDAKSFYFILSGHVQVYKIENDVRMNLNELTAGDSFGELALLKGTKRTASILTTSRSEFLRIDKDDYLDVMKATADEDLQSKLAFFQSVPFLADLPLASLVKLAETCTKRDWPTNAVIVKEREPLANFYLIRSGL
ncbi:hypothetical protein AMAG_12832 [Allomyces macrogynus ATCC 38327]|uniref:Cyclic nucleotide-binding domain-containing protein n=1 Tax=Allomyces macrogynus (strain ATCC 38327) TaxID=578462 RepID=A0A0L0T269_ALLM3|nr:hypothetical protein AMAG_12832 [Allomyces macrogynus ATCC 38327]|eukprot:KNE68664.1 hypothetical protein AMAG_12832 [Allomyces macrogynus ATCC 38327]